MNNYPCHEESEVTTKEVSFQINGDRDGKTGLACATTDISGSSCCMAIKSSTWVEVLIGRQIGSLTPI